MMLEKSYSGFNKLGIILLIGHCIIVLTFVLIDTMDALQTSSSGFAQIPIFIVDYPISKVASWCQQLIPMVPASLGNKSYVIVQKIRFAIPFLILGSLQWYFIGWAVSKVFNSLRK